MKYSNSPKLYLLMAGFVLTAMGIIFFFSPIRNNFLKMINGLQGVNTNKKLLKKSENYYKVVFGFWLAVGIICLIIGLLI